MAQQFRPWQRGLVEFLAIFLGVSMSFIADDWREDIGNRQAVERMLSGIQADMGQDLAFIGRRLERNSLAEENGSWLLANWTRTDLPTDSIEQALAYMYQGGDYQPVRSEYESAKSAGRMQLLRSEELRSAIANVYEQVKPHAVNVAQMSIDADFELFRALRPYVEFSGEFGSGLGAFPELSLARPWPEIQRDLTLRNTLVNTVAFRRTYSTAVRTDSTQTEQVRELVAEELDR
jgi:hypothetical protein